jgi:hypothetical protein
LGGLQLFATLLGPSKIADLPANLKMDIALSDYGPVVISREIRLIHSAELGRPTTPPPNRVAGGV